MGATYQARVAIPLPGPLSTECTSMRVRCMREGPSVLAEAAFGPETLRGLLEILYKPSVADYVKQIGVISGAL